MMGFDFYFQALKGIYLHAPAKNFCHFRRAFNTEQFGDPCSSIFQILIFTTPHIESWHSKHINTADSMYLTAMDAYESITD
jgi:hypothetical protein